MYVHWSWRSIASECELPCDFSSTLRRTITKPIPGAPSMHLPEAATTASIGHCDTSISIAPNELIASTMRPRFWRAHACAMSARGLRIPVPVSQCTCATCVMAGSRASASSTIAPLAIRSSGMSSATCARPRYFRILRIRWQYAPFCGTRTLPSRGTTFESAASTENVPLPCNGTQTCVSSPCTTATRSLQIDAVIALKDASHEPQSRSIACLVSSDVVRGPGVRRMGSFPRIMVGFSRGAWDILVIEPDGRSRRRRRGQRRGEEGKHDEREAGESRDDRDDPTDDHEGEDSFPHAVAEAMAHRFAIPVRPAHSEDDPADQRNRQNQERAEDDQPNRADHRRALHAGSEHGQGRLQRQGCKQTAGVARAGQLLHACVRRSRKRCNRK